jgi:hypothetical protein
VQVVDDKHRRLPEREVRCQPVEAVQHREGVLGSSTCGVRASKSKEGRRKLGRTWEKLGTEVARRRSERRLEQLTDDPEGKVAFELAGAGGHDLESSARRERAHLGEQPRLADPGTSLDHGQAAVALKRGLDQRQQDAQFRLPLEQCAIDRSEISADTATQWSVELGHQRPCPSVSSSRVEPSMFMNRKVTVLETRAVACVIAASESLFPRQPQE